jgi:hypothetical protein
MLNDGYKMYAIVTGSIAPFVRRKFELIFHRDAAMMTGRESQLHCLIAVFHN